MDPDATAIQRSTLLSSGGATQGHGSEFPPPAVGAPLATAAAAGAPSASVASSSNKPSSSASSGPDDSTLITPAKAVIEQQQQTQQQQASQKAPSVHRVKWPPVSSARSLPPLSGRAEDLLLADESPSSGKAGSRDTIEFEVNQECTSIGLVPSGRIAVAGFTDGTLRLFDLTGIFAKDKNHPDNRKDDSAALFDDDSSVSSEEGSFQSSLGTGMGKNAKSMSVDSRVNQRYGAVACQIHAKGVHTSLLMDVAVSEDGLYAFGGVQRGSVELAAVYLGDVEGYLDGREQEASNDVHTPEILDLIQVDRHADAKLKGFGACVRLWNGWDRVKGGERPEYLLFTGRGIKNIHIWSYKPSHRDEDATWTCLYDTPGNGTSIHQLYFRHNLHGSLQAISKSDDQKLRVWDLTYEQRRVAEGTDGSDRPKRPDYVDVASTEGTIGVCGPYAFASGSLGGMHNIINVVGLDADDVSSPFNSTELALPIADAGGEYLSRRTSRTGRQQRGDLTSVVHVAGLSHDAGHALLQLSNGSVVHYMHDQSGHPLLLQSPSSLCTTSIDDDASFGALAGTSIQNKRMSLARVGSQGMVLFAVSSFNENSSRGALMLRALPGSSGEDSDGRKHRKYWGFNGLKKKRKHASAPASKGVGKASSIKKLEPSAAASLLALKADKLASSESKKAIRPGKKAPEETVDCTPAPANETGGDKKARAVVRKVTPGDLISPAPYSVVKTAAKIVASAPGKKRQSGNAERMDSQLESIAQEPVHSPTRTGQSATKKQKVAKTPVKSSRKKATPSKDDVPKPKGTSEKKVGFVGMTVLDRRVTASLPETCYQPKVRPQLLVEQLPKTTIESRLANAPAAPSQLPAPAPTSNPTESAHFQRQCDERQKLAAKHRAEHEMVRKRVLHTVRSVLATWDVEIGSNRSHASIVDSARRWFDESLAGHQENLDDILGRQMLEAESLAARQTAELRDARAMAVRVSFPFPEVFEQARQEMLSLVK
ncbi:hypothetical protein ACHAXT_006825 [Thalassiosira profunda]